MKNPCKDKAVASLAYVLGVDIGTTGVKALVMDIEGNIAGSGYREYSCRYPQNGWVEQSASQLVENAYEAIREALQSAGIDRKALKAVSLSAQRATFGLVDKDNRIIGDTFYVWQDSRATEVMDAVRSRMEPYELYSIGGQPVTPTFTLEKIVWLQKYRPELLKEAQFITWVPDYIMLMLGADSLVCDVANACCSGMLDINSKEWSDRILTAFDIDRKLLPPLARSGEAIGRVNEEAALKTGIPAGTLICCGSGDNQCGALGAGVLREGEACLSLGTSGVLVVGVERPVFHQDMGLMVTLGLAPGLYELESIQLGAASGYKWARDVICSHEKALGSELEIDPFTLMEHHLNASPVGARGIQFMPYLMGAGYPHWNLDMEGSFLGMRLSTTKSDLIRGVMEGITLESKDMYEGIKQLGIEISQLSIIGGATKSKAWRQMIADMLGVPVRTLETSDAPAVGACILAGYGAGLFDSLESGVSNMVRFRETLQPIEENVAMYKQKYHSFKSICQNMLNTCNSNMKIGGNENERNGQAV